MLLGIDCCFIGHLVRHNKFNHRATCVFQRPGAFAVYLEPWHFDVFEFLELKKNTGKEEQRARDLFFAMWIPDLFMKRVESNQVSAWLSGHMWEMYAGWITS